MNIIIEGPQGCGKTRQAQDIAHRLTDSPINIQSIQEARAQIMYGVGHDYRIGGTIVIVFDGVISTPREAIVAVETVNQARAHFAHYHVIGIFVDNGQNFVLTDRQIKL